MFLIEVYKSTFTWSTIYDVIIVSNILFQSRDIQNNYTGEVPNWDSDQLFF